MNQGRYCSSKLNIKINTQQNQYFLDHVEEMLLLINPSRIIEIGTARGGVTLLMSDILYKHNMYNSKIKTFDISMRAHLKNIKVPNIEFYVGNVFRYKDESLIKEEEITNFISKDHTNLFLCDGGYKVKEFITLCPYLKSGDVIMLHDYAPNKEIFESEYKDKIWNWMEVTDKDILPCIEKYNLSYYEMGLIKPSAWVALIKK